MKFETIFATTKQDTFRKVQEYKKTLNKEKIKMISTPPKKIKNSWCVDITLIEKDNGFFNELVNELL